MIKRTSIAALLILSTWAASGTELLPIPLIDSAQATVQETAGDMAVRELRGMGYPARMMPDGTILVPGPVDPDDQGTINQLVADQFPGSYLIWIYAGGQTIVIVG